ncbi:hypothetical protein PX699_00300 [Sphingobium sp. H39-3-25]|uniref:hypothetical protein n=1 Tax=Sphingobium arseniciresistens TaxID=3030834 RepID=UPI0023BA1E00|nr:hypothetical protein [Sphingobium arseniciresistens]
MPAWLIRILPHVLVVAAVLGAIWWIDHRGYARARKDAAYERMVTATMIVRARRDSEAAMAAEIAAIGRTVGDQVAGIRQINRTIVQPTLTKEIASNARYSDPAAGVSVQLLDAINAARAASACAATAAGGIVCTLPKSAADTGAGSGPAGDGDDAGHP